ncbi:MAG: heme-binding protein [Proteobacteria bacterium]|nr:heme-binding protein [Pseudomonadota bacterium]
MKPLSKKSSKALALISLLYAPLALYAGDSLTVKTISLDLAQEIAMISIEACRKKGYQVSAVVVDRNGLIQVALRDDLASRFTLQIAEEKANSVILSGSNSGEFRKSRGDIRPELNHMDDIIIMQGALPIEIAGSRIGAIGVSGAPGGDIDEACAQSALEKVSERLQFAE